MGNSIISGTTKNPYFIAFMKHKGIGVGDEFKGYEFINWIQDMHREFRKEFKLDKELEWIPYTSEQAKQFVKWLGEKVGFSMEGQG